MDKKIYEKTRYDNIYRHIKNKNYIIMVNKPKKTSISKINFNKIYDINVAKDYKMKLELNQQKIIKNLNKDDFDVIWNEYIYFCENISKLSYGTIRKKKILYNCYLNQLNKYRITEIRKETIIDLINSVSTTDKQKNTILIILKAFFNWCEDDDRKYIYQNPTKSIKQIKTSKTEMKYWNIEEFQKFFDYLRTLKTHNAYKIYILVMIELHLGDRIGETRALTWDCIDDINNTITISHSINYDPKSEDYLSSTKNYQSDRIVDVSPKLIQEIMKYKEYLLTKHESLNNIIFYNYSTKKPYSDVNLRNLFYKYSKDAKLKKIRLYDLRHTYVTMMMTEGWELYHISKRLGHSNYSTTVNKYGHLESKVRKEIAKTTDKYL